MADWQEEEKLQHLFEEAIKDIQQKEPLEASIQTPIKANFTKNFALGTKNQFFEPIGFTSSTASTDAIGSIDTSGFTSFIENIDAIGFIKNIRPIEEKKLVLENVTQQLLESKHILILG